MTDRRIIVCGSRDWSDTESLTRALNIHFLDHGDVLMVHGDCPTGADWLAQGFANKWDLRVEAHPANWKLHGKAAGPVRNQEMADAGAKLCLAFWDGESRGTLDMIQRAIRAGIPVKIVPPMKESR